jgi:hypothetical protein
MSQVILNPLPKTRFQESKDNVSKHRDMVASREFERAIDFALLHYQASLTLAAGDHNFNNMAVMGLKIAGAQEFVHQLRTLSESRTVTINRPDDNLIHNTDVLKEVAKG